MNKTRLKGWIRELGWFALIIVGVLAARSSLADHYYVPSGSMQHSLYAGDRVVVDKRAYGLRLPFTLTTIAAAAAVQRGDVVIFDSPRDGKRLIKRIVAIGGDTAAIIDGHLIINGRSMGVPGNALLEDFGGKLVSINLDGGGGPDFVATVPEGQLLAVGDNRGNSLDGRIFGFVDEAEIYGKALAVYYRKGEGFAWLGL
jgi:signal peptidase I